jgi:hypothetical protein
MTIKPFKRKDGATEFTCTNCGVYVLAEYEVLEALCLNCQYGYPRQIFARENEKRET